MEIENTCCPEKAKEENQEESRVFDPELLENRATLAAHIPGNSWNHPNPNLPRIDIINREASMLGLMLDSGNAQLAQLRLQNDLIQLRPNRYAQNLLLNQLNIMDRKGVGSDLMLGHYNPYNQTFSYGYIVPSVFRPYPTFPVYY